MTSKKLLFDGKNLFFGLLNDGVWLLVKNRTKTVVFLNINITNTFLFVLTDQYRMIDTRHWLIYIVINSFMYIWTTYWHIPCLKHTHTHMYPTQYNYNLAPTEFSKNKPVCFLYIFGLHSFHYFSIYFISGCVCTA